MHSVLGGKMYTHDDKQRESARSNAQTVSIREHTFEGARAMLNVKCESCEAPYQIDERRVPPTGLKMRCPKCGHSFMVMLPGQTAAAGATPPPRPAPAAPPPPPPRAVAPTMVSAADDDDQPTLMSHDGEPPPASISGIDASWGAPEPVANFGELDLPAVAASLPVASAALPMASASLPKLAAQLPRVSASLPSIGAQPPQVFAPPPSVPDQPVLSAVPPQAPPPAPAPKVAPASIDLGFDLDFGNVQAPVPAPAVAPAPVAPLSMDLSLDMGKPDAAPAPEIPSMDLPPMPTETAGHLTLDLPREEAAQARAEAPPASAGAPESGLSLGMPGPASSAMGTAVAAKKRTTFLNEQPGSKGGAGAAKKPGAKTVLAAAGVLVVLGGGALELTKAGAYGRYVISDLIKAPSYQRAADEMLAELRASYAKDDFKGSAALAQKAAAAPDAMPRAIELRKAAALAIYMTVVRFGPDASRTAKADEFVASLPPEQMDPVLEAAQRAAHGDYQVALDRARSGQSTMYAVERDLITADSLLGMRRTKEAIEAYKQALAGVPGVRVRFALARASSALGDTKQAGKWIGEALAANPTHFEAKILSLRVALDNMGPDETLLREVERIIANPSFDSESKRGRADAFSLRGDFARASGRPTEADKSYATAVALDPSSPTALVGQAEVYFKASRFTEALSRFDAVRVADPTRPDALIGVAKSKLMLFLPIEAKRSLEALRTTNPTSPQATYWLGRAAERLGDKDAAEKLYREAMGLVQPKAFDAYEPYVALSDLLYRSGRTAEAQELETKAMAVLQHGTLLSTALGDAAMARGAYEDAVRSYATAVEACQDKSGDCGPLHLKIASMYRHERNFSSARAELDAARKLDPTTPGLALEEGRLFVDSGEIEKAISSYTAAMAKNPGDLEIPVRLADAYIASGKPDKALPLLEKLTQPTSGNAEAFAVLARAKYAIAPEHALDALPHARRAAELDGGRADYLVLIAQIANEAVPPQLGLARETVERAIGIDPASAEAYVQRANVERRSGAVQDALRDVHHALDLAPGLNDANATLAECMEDTNQRGEAHALWTKVVAAQPSSAYWQYKLGQSFRDRGANAEAASHLRLALAAYAKKTSKPVWYEQALFAGGMTMVRSGARKEGIELLKQFLAVAPETSPDRREAQEAMGVTE